MEKVNHKKVFIITLLKIVLMITIFFTINNWGNIKQSINGEVPAFQVWLNHAITPSNFIFIVLLSVIFYMNTLKAHKELAEKHAKNADL
ncbi:MAG: hypothetical protein V4663_01175 [Bacteroidota bacterium]